MENGSPAKRHLNVIGDRVNSPLRRKSICVMPKKDGDTNNDEIERNIRRNRTGCEVRVSDVHNQSLNGSVSSALGTETSGNLQDHYNICLRMFTQNKINLKNAWNLHIFEYMRDMVQNNGELGNMLQIAGISLDIGTKVYSLRVDDAHSDTLKLANALSTLNIRKKNQDNNNLDDGEHSDSQSEQTPAEKNKRQKKQRNLDCLDKRITVAENEETLNGVIQKHPGLINRCSETTDANSLLNITLTKSVGQSFELLVPGRSSNCLWIKGNGQQEIPEESTQKFKLKLGPLPNLKICPSFADFSIDNLTKLQELTQTRLDDDDQMSLLPDLDLDTENIDPNAEDDFLAEDVECADHGCDAETAYITDMKPGNAVHELGKTLEYSYRPLPNMSENFNIIGIWRGPSYWKPKSLRGPVNRAANELANPKKKAKVVRVDKHFEESAWAEAKNLLENPNISKKTTRLKITTAMENVLLPEPLAQTLAIKQAPWMLLSCIPTKQVSMKNLVPVENLNVSNYLYDNPNDNEYCGDVEVNDEWANGSDGEASHFPPTQNEDELIAAPQLVPESYVAYATKAKKMDMKKLKTTIWKELVGQNNVIENSEDKMDVETEIPPTPFGDVYKLLPEKLSDTMAENLSCSLAFVALLHLCNEHNLKLESNEALSDVIITRDT